jgi:hypothetical protein
MRNYSFFIIASGQVGGSPVTAVNANNDELQFFLSSLDPGSISLAPTTVWMPNSKEYFQYWINQGLGSTGYSDGALQLPFFWRESPRGSGRFEYPGYPRITFGTK